MSGSAEKVHGGSAVKVDDEAVVVLLAEVVDCDVPVEEAAVAAGNVGKTSEGQADGTVKVADQ